MDQWWVDEARNALRNFAVLRQTHDGAGQAILAEAGTGTMYEVYVQPVLYGNPDSEVLVTCYSPWRSCAKIGRIDMMHPNYIAEKLRGTTMDEIHPGDLYAVMMCIYHITGAGMFTPDQVR